MKKSCSNTLNQILPVLACAVFPLFATHCASTPKPKPQTQSFRPALQTPHYAPTNPYAVPPPAPAQVPIAPPPPSYRPFVSPSHVASNAPDIRAKSYILIDPNTGRVIAARNADEVRVPASTQKLLTALIIAESGNLDKMVRITASDCAVEPTKAGIRPGEVYSRRQLLTALLVRSCNDIANALARDNAGSTYAFAQKMNARARMIGVTDSHFTNPHGLTAPGQYSTARDIARIAAVAYRNPVIRDCVRRRSYTFRFNNGRVITLKNTNELFNRMPECNGMKTGYTNAAGRCLVSSAQRNGRDVILVQLGTKTTYIWEDAEILMRWGLAR